MNKQEPIKVALLGMNERTQSLLDIFFSGRGRDHGCVVEERTANAAIIDMDFPGSEEVWERYHNQRHGPSIVFSVHERHLPDTVWLPKPLNINELVEATDKLDLLLNNGGYTPTADKVREAFQPTEASSRSRAVPKSISWHERQVQPVRREATPVPLPEVQPEEKPVDLVGKSRWTDPFEERLRRYQSMAKAAPTPSQQPVRLEKAREPVILDRRETKVASSVRREVSRFAPEAVNRPADTVRPYPARVQPAQSFAALPAREERRREARGSTVAWLEPSKVVQEVGNAVAIAAVPAPALFVEEEEIRAVEPLCEREVRHLRSPELEKNGIHDAHHLHEDHFAIEDDFCEHMADVDLSNPEERETILYSPEAYLLGDVTSALDAARKTHRPVLIEAMRERIVFFPESNLLFTTFDPYHLKKVCGEPLHRSEVSTHILGDRESVVLEDQISGGKLVNADTFLWSMSIWTSLGRLPRDFDIHMPVTLKHWPNLTRLPPTPHAMRIASLWSQRAVTLEETAQLLEIPQRCVFAFFNAASALGRLRFVPGAKSHGGLASHKNRGLFSKLLHKLGNK
ncbi:MAG: hypothetical protein A2286_03340 [Gammaproteobacteria bacterium RIFOXYA12_FULL_61_12]|nr:MAG: hypothetical protein A2514_04475 [Gammaproteobacteria bacterium RIFOXYD12_FULL_61_37]OGT93300.1 MAG: hypothetical protein A2286_03340 [Gammaproteobacteria bacterium RIFOXYA12_FULL_61_12]